MSKTTPPPPTEFDPEFIAGLKAIFEEKIVFNQVLGLKITSLRPERVLARIDMGHTVVPAHEQWAAVGGAITNFLNAAHLLGFAGKMLSGHKVRQPAIQAAFCGAGETLVGWIALGTPVKSPSRAGSKPRALDVLSDWPAQNG